MQWFSQLLDVFTPKIKRKSFDFYILWIKTNVPYTRLEMIARTKYCTTTTASNWFVTLYYKLLPAVRSSSKHGRWRSSLLLYSISMIMTMCASNNKCAMHNREDAYSHTGGIFIRDTAYLLWFNEVWAYASLNHNEYAVSRAVSLMKMPPVREYASSLMCP